MTNKIIFGADLIDVLENKYNMNQLANVPTKYKNGVTTIDFIYGKEKEIDDLKYNKPYIEFSIDDETDGFISGTMYLNGGVEGIQFDSWEDLKYFMKNAKWTESKKSTRKSIKESKDLTDLCNAWVIGDVVGKFKNRDYCHKGNDYSVFNIGNIIENALRDNYILEFDGDNKAKSVIFYMVDKDGKNVGSLEIYPDERYEISNYEDGYDLSKLDMDEIADLFYEFQNNKIEYLLSDKRFDFTDKFWYNESKKSATKSLKEGIDVKIVYADDTPSEYIDDVTHNDILDIIEESPEVYKIYDVGGSKKKLVWSDEYGFERAYESKKSARKSLKEGINDELIATSSDGETTLYLSDERQANHGKDPHYEFKLGENGYFTRYVRCDDNRCENVVLDWIKEFNLDISKSEISKIIKLHESKKSVKKSLKESKYSDFFNGIAKEYHFSKDEKTRYKDKTHISAIGVLFDRINNAIKIYGRNSDEEYNALNDCWSVITSAKQNGWDVDYEEDKWNKIAGLPNYH